MNDLPDSPSPYGRERICPHCGTRVAQRANRCFFCGSALAGGSRRRLSVPWADIVLFAVIAGLVALWWTRPPATASEQEAAPTDTPTLAAGDWVRMAAFQPDASPAGPVGGAFTATPLPPSPATTVVPTPVKHKVVPGESVPLVAENYGVKARDIIALNNLSSDGMIHPGDMLLIPNAAAPPPPAPTATPTGGTLIYKVQAGDSFAGLAQRFHTDMEWILQANKLKMGDFLAVGQYLLIPLSQSTPQPTVTATPTPPPPTFTPVAGLRAPVLLAPPDEAALAGDQVMLSWESVGLLAEDEWYVVLVRPAGSPRPLPPYSTKTTSWRLPPEFNLPGEKPVHYTWQVQVMRGKPGEPDVQVQPITPPSAPRSFTW